MKKRLLTIMILLFIILRVSAQFFFIPVIIPTYREYYNCPSKDEKAIEYFTKGLDNFSNNKQLAIIYFKGAIQRDSFFCDSYYALINTFRSTKDYDSALKYTDLVLRFNKLDKWALKVKGLVFLNDKKFEKASAHFDSLFKMQPREATWLYYYIQSLIKLNKVDTALKLTLEMEMLMQQQEGWDSKTLSFYLQSQIAFQKMNYKTAYRGFKEIQSKYKNNPEYCFIYGVTLMRKEKPNYRKAKRFIKRAIRLGYDNVDSKIRDELKI